MNKSGLLLLVTLLSWASGNSYYGGQPSSDSQKDSPADNDNYWWLKNNPFRKPSNHPGVEGELSSGVKQSQTQNPPKEKFNKPTFPHGCELLNKDDCHPPDAPNNPVQNSNNDQSNSNLAEFQRLGPKPQNQQNYPNQQSEPKQSFQQQQPQQVKQNFQQQPQQQQYQQKQQYQQSQQNQQYQQQAQQRQQYQQEEYEVPQYEERPIQQHQKRPQVQEQQQKSPETFQQQNPRPQPQQQQQPQSYQQSQYQEPQQPPKRVESQNTGAPNNAQVPPGFYRPPQVEGSNPRPSNSNFGHQAQYGNSGSFEGTANGNSGTQRPAGFYTPPTQQTQNSGNNEEAPPYPGCPAAMLCVNDDLCNFDGVIEEKPIGLTQAQKAFRVALMACSSPMTGEVGVCCRDPTYKDPWPDMNGGAGKFDDGKYHGDHSNHAKSVGHQQKGSSHSSHHPQQVKVAIKRTPQASRRLVQCKVDEECQDSIICEEMKRNSEEIKIDIRTGFNRKCQEDFDGIEYICCKRNPQILFNESNQKPIIQLPLVQFSPLIPKKSALISGLGPLPFQLKTKFIFGSSTTSYNPYVRDPPIFLINSTSRPSTRFNLGQDFNSDVRSTTESYLVNSNSDEFNEETSNYHNEEFNREATNRTEKSIDAQFFIREFPEEKTTVAPKSLPIPITTTTEKVELKLSEMNDEDSTTTMNPEEETTTIEPEIIYDNSPVVFSVPSTTYVLPPVLPKRKLDSSPNIIYPNPFKIPSQNYELPQEPLKIPSQSLEPPIEEVKVSVKPEKEEEIMTTTMMPSSDPPQSEEQSSEDSDEEFDFSNEHPENLPDFSIRNPFPPESQSPIKNSIVVTVCPDNMKCLREIHCQPIDPNEGNIKLFDVRAFVKKEQRTRCRQASLPVEGVCCFLREDFRSIPSTPRPTKSPEIAVRKVSKDVCGIRRPRESEDDENTTEFGEFPWQVLITRQGGTQCGGVVVSNRAIATSAACVHKLKASELNVRVGEWDTKNPSDKLSNDDLLIDALISHPDFNPINRSNDVALLFTNKPIKFGYHVGKICLPQPVDKFIGKRCISTGWGTAYDANGTQHSDDVLKQVVLPILPTKLCEEGLRKTNLGQDFSLDANTMCAGGETNRDVCTGDQGGPLVCMNPGGSYTLIGIKSWSISCGEPSIPAVFTFIPAHAVWLHSFLKQVPENVINKIRLKE